MRDAERRADGIEHDKPDRQWRSWCVAFDGILGGDWKRQAFVCVVTDLVDSRGYCIVEQRLYGRRIRRLDDVHVVHKVERGPSRDALSSRQTRKVLGKLEQSRRRHRSFGRDKDGAAFEASFVSRQLDGERELQSKMRLARRSAPLSSDVVDRQWQ